jgi:hypothetical protein
MSILPPTLRIQQYTVAPELFTTGYSIKSGPWTCTSQCCGGGAYVDVTERDVVLQHAELIQPHLDETQTRDPARWFESEEKVDRDYKSGVCVGTTVEDGKCIMQDKRGWCSIQVAATEAGRYKWDIKPLYCVLFPIEVIDNVIRYDRRFHELRECCTAKAEFEIPLFEACRDEVVHLVGEAGFKAMAEHYASYYTRPPVAIANDGHLRVVPE